MKAVIFGSGQIGCGFAGHLLHASGYQIVFACNNPIIAEHLNRVGHYRVKLVQGAQTSESVVDNVRAVHIGAADVVARELSSADLIVTAVGAKNLPVVARLIATGLMQRNRPLNILAFENLANAGTCLREQVSAHLSAEFPIKDYGFSGVLISRAVTQQLGDPSTDQPLTFVGDPPETFVVDGQSLSHPLPTIKGMVVSKEYHAHIRRKLYIFSAGHATGAYLGHLKGYNYIHTAIRDPEIRAAVLAAMREGQKGLAAQYGAELAGDERDLLEIVARFENAALKDSILRVGRDPQRKLDTEDRLVGAARLAENAGIHPEKLLMAVAAAFCFRNPADPSANQLGREIEATGLDPVLSQICSLDAKKGLGRYVADTWGQLANGWQRESVLLTLDEMMWACH